MENMSQICPLCKSHPKADLCVACVYDTEALQEIEKLKEERDEARAKIIGACEVCWTNSWVPIESEKECELVHPHKTLKDHARCEYCWHLKAWELTLVRYRKALEKAEPYLFNSPLEGALDVHAIVNAILTGRNENE